MALLQLLKQSSKLFYLSSSFLLLAIISLKYVFRKRKLSYPPSPPKLPFIGNLHQLGAMPHVSLQRLGEKYGPIFSLKLGEIPTVVVSSPRLAKEALKTHDLAFASRPQLLSAKGLFYGCTDMAFAPYGAYWRGIRKICILEVLSARKVQSIRFVREEEVARLVNRVAESFPVTTNLSKLLGLYANDILCRVVLGKTYSDGGEYDRLGFRKMLDDFHELLGGFSLGDYFPSLEFVHNFTGMKSKLDSTFKRFDQFFDEVISEHLSPGRKTAEYKDLVDVLLDIQRSESAETPLTMENVKANMLVMFAAGTDTTFITLDWAMTELMMNTKMMEKAKAEVRNIVGEKRFVQESDLHHMHYMKAIIKEVLRLHPPVPVSVPRESLEDVTMEGYKIPAKTRIYVNVYAIARDPTVWENPDKFDPERFMGSSIDYKGQDFELLPFGAGRRICPGLMFAAAAVELAFAQLLHSFDWELPPGVKPQDIDNTEAFGITTHRMVPLRVISRPRF
ncbi:hypothetical protein K2173_001051 [Erythroxylum novogranatense]|uniref:Cytochrome P450 n=1 Tax=Erythroxylum novogranatense TaxID=1862640 RepID=A0AAV8SJE4_9ROSI|nr:hypothetical protein K2173_001051 [Erythroxylum novogranatense]